MLFLASTLFALARLAVAQDSNSTASATDIALAQANFNNAELVPDLLQKFNPEGVLQVSFGGQEIEIGQKLAQDAVSSSPSLAVLPGSDASDINGSNKYTVMMIDADIVGTNALNTPLTRHWLVNGATLNSASAPYQVTYDSATSITDYAGPGPASGSGSHRYTLLVYLQPDSFQAPSNLSTAGTPLGTMMFQEYVSSTGLGALIAANYIQVENGEATVSVVQTSTVNPSALAGISTSASGASATSMMSMTSGASSRTSGSATSAAAAASSSGAAAHGREMGWSVAVGAVGVAGAVLGAGLGF